MKSKGQLRRQRREIVAVVIGFLFLIPAVGVVALAVGSIIAGAK